MREDLRHEHLYINGLVHCVLADPKDDTSRLIGPPGIKTELEVMRDGGAGRNWFGRLPHPPAVISCRTPVCFGPGVTEQEIGELAKAWLHAAIQENKET